MKAKNIRVVVYGTLKQGYGNHVLLRNAEYVGRVRLYGKYTMLDGMFPIVLNDKIGTASGAVHGELYVVDEDTLRALDHLEGHPNFYKRIRVPVEGHKPAWLYVMPADSRFAEEGERVIPSGAWRIGMEEVAERVEQFPVAAEDFKVGG